MNIQEATVALKGQLARVYDDAEAGNISDWVMESLTGQNRSERILAKNTGLSPVQEEQLAQYSIELMQNRPVQYVLGESYFYGLKLFVDENVLIPRPETEELVDWVVKREQWKTAVNPVMMDIGTGSGCIALALKKSIPHAEVYAMDIAEGALAVASNNANRLNIDIHFIKGNILSELEEQDLPMFDVIVSNPPYITVVEKEAILPNVLHFEPHLALFVDNGDPLQFYKAIEVFAGRYLNQDGSVFLELHRDFAVDTRQYFAEKGWKTVLRRDMQDNLRMLRCLRMAVDPVV